MAAIETRAVYPMPVVDSKPSADLGRGPYGIYRWQGEGIYGAPYGCAPDCKRRGTIGELQAYAAEQGWKWKRVKRYMFGGYWTDDKSEIYEIW